MERDLDIEVTEDNRDALKGALEVLSRTSDADLLNGGPSDPAQD